MQIETDLTKNHCQYKKCRHWNEGKCLNAKARKDCIDVALAVLFAREKIEANLACDFCVDLRGALIQNEIDCDAYNRKDKVGRARAQIGVKYIAYLTDAHRRYKEKESRVFKFSYCPVCGRYLKGFD